MGKGKEYEEWKNTCEPKRNNVRKVCVEGIGLYFQEEIFTPLFICFCKSFQALFIDTRFYVISLPECRTHFKFFGYARKTI